MAQKCCKSDYVPTARLPKGQVIKERWVVDGKPAFVVVHDELKDKWFLMRIVDGKAIKFKSGKNPKSFDYERVHMKEIKERS